ncbi:VanZ family protein [Bacillus sp. NPDC077027]|uniref:VanZ family protein n=1 Tax=Bacillus sp. NPDC077027 TaxID=3390548 RepID=UPI003D036C2A
MKLLSSLPIGSLLLLVLLFVYMRFRYAKKRNQSMYLFTETALAFLFFYTSTLLYLTVLPNQFSAAKDQVSINFIPFHSIYQNFHALHHGYPALVYLNIIGNILLFVPIGFLLFCGFKKMTWQKAVLSGFLLSTSIEMLQFLFSTYGIITRSSDVDDMILNTLGTAIGCMFYILYRSKKGVLR